MSDEHALRAGWQRMVEAGFVAPGPSGKYRIPMLDALRSDGYTSEALFGPDLMAQLHANANSGNEQALGTLVRGPMTDRLREVVRTHPDPSLRRHAENWLEHIDALDTPHIPYIAVQWRQ